jgi:hypothetical protein
MRRRYSPVCRYCTAAPECVGGRTGKVSGMTAQPIESEPHRMWTPDPLRQRLANDTIEDGLALPDDAPRVEVRDGVMCVDSDTELVLDRPFDIRLPIGDITP